MADTYLVHLTEAQARRFLRETHRASAQLTAAIYLFWFAVGGASGCLIVGRDWRAAPVGLLLGALFSAWLFRASGPSAQLETRIDQARETGARISRPARVSFQPDGLHVDWHPGATLVAWEAVETRAVAEGIFVSVRNFAVPVLLVPASNPLADRLQQRPCTGGPLEVPESATHTATFLFGRAELDAIRQANGMKPRTFRRLLGVGVLLLAASLVAGLYRELELAAGLVGLGVVLGFTAVVEPVSNWLGQRRAPPSSSPTTIGLIDDAWFTLTRHHRSEWPISAQTSVQTTTGHVVIGDEGVVAAIPKHTLAQPESLVSSLRERIEHARASDPVPGEFAPESTSSPSNPYAPPHSPLEHDTP